MQPVIYDVAVSVDGYIAGPDGDVSQFAHDGPVVEDYFARLVTYSCAIMGRATYEFGYRFGLEPGSNPYPNLKTIVFSKSISLPQVREVELVEEDWVGRIRQLCQNEFGPIYLCGGGEFAGFLLSAGLIDILRLKRAPVILGSGTKLFAEVAYPPQLACAETKPFDNGYVFQEFEIQKLL